LAPWLKMSNRRTWKIGKQHHLNVSFSLTSSSNLGLNEKINNLFLRPFALCFLNKCQQSSQTKRFTDAAITGWTSPTPAITTASGNIEIASAVVEGSVAVGAQIFQATATSGGTISSYNLVSSTDSVGVLGTTGAINVATGKSLDYETAAKYVFVVR